MTDAGRQTTLALCTALKGRDTTAQGAALGGRAARVIQALKGRDTRAGLAAYLALSGLPPDRPNPTEGCALGSRILRLRGVVPLSPETRA